MFLDTMYVGKLKGVGPVWQFAACDGAGIELKKITSDRGPEFGRRFSQALRERGIRHRRLPPRSPNLNGFVERLHGRPRPSRWMS
ncbi:MAG TPA: hypothetical protein VNP94_09780 [Actinomycetota bacterium]|nr:hypothetical protein [Actinomycetota bacterium]